MHHERLLPVSILGFIVNLIGIFVFQHGGHGHSHGSGRMSIIFSTVSFCGTLRAPGLNCNVVLVAILGKWICDLLQY